MNLEQIQKFTTTQKRGRFFKVLYESAKGDYKKVSSMVVRMVKYENIKDKEEPKGDKKPTNNYTLIKGSDVIYYNSNTKNLYLQVATTKVKSRSKCYKNDEEITIEEYNQATKKKARKGSSPVLKLRLSGILAIG